jgi:hypothetical protein
MPSWGVNNGKNLRILRGCRQITAFYNQHAEQPVEERDMYKLIARGTVPAGKDGTALIAEGNTILAALLKNAGGEAA